MHNRGVRLAFAFVFLLAAVVVTYLLYNTHTSSRAALAAQSAIDSELDTVGLSIAELRASEQAYVAAGQGEGYWISRVRERLALLRTDLAALAARVASAEARKRLEAAAATLEDFAQMDERASEYAKSGQRLLASDLIFADGWEMTRAAQDEVVAAQTAERSAVEAVVRLADRRQALTVAVAGAGALLLVFMLAPPARAPAAAAAAKRSGGPQPPSDILGLALDADLTRLDRGRPAPAPAPTSGDASTVTRAADLCADLARVHEPRHLSALLERTAQVLDAAGIIVWIADPDRRELVPTLTHGYKPAALARFGTIARDADNATAAAFREGTLKTVAADGPASGAIVAPLVTASGCVGVIAAEVNAERERDPMTRALARIIAAQIAALIGAPPAAARTPRAAEA